MKNILIHCSWDLHFSLEHEKQIELYVDNIPLDHPGDSIRFVFLAEPPEIIDLSHLAFIGLEAGSYHFLLTHNQSLLDLTPKAHLVEFGGCWIENYAFPQKTFGVSTLVGGKRMAPGHLLRQDLWGNQNKITIPTSFFISGNYGGISNPLNNLTLGSSKEPLFDTQFSICIENTKRQNWFTEKLIDCLVTKTVPIYWGCPNIGDWFNTKGFIIANDLEDIIAQCNNLNENTYSEMLPYIEENLILAEKFRAMAPRIKNKIENLISENFS